MKNLTKTLLGSLALSALAALVFLAYQGNGRAANTAPPEPAMAPDTSEAVSVRTTPVNRMVFEERLIVQGNLEAKDVVVVPVRIPGIIEKIYVDEGDRVEAGKTKLFQVEALKLRKAAAVSRNDLEAAKCSLREKIAGLEKVEADLDKNLKDYKRFETLYKQRTVSADSYETRQSSYRKTLAERKHAQALVDLTREQVRQAESALDMAEKDLRDALVYAPINGVVSRRSLEAGEMGMTGQPVVRLVDTSVIEASALLAAQYYPRITANQTFMTVRVYGQDLGLAPITYKSPTIDPQLRTFEIKALLDNVDGRIAPGAMADLEVSLYSREGWGVPEEAVLTRSEGSVIFIIKDGRAHEVDVKTGLENDGLVEVSAEGLEEGLPVVTLGQSQLEEGALVRIKEDGA